MIFGNARPAGVGPNPARQIAWRAGLGDDVPAFTVNMACASGLRAVVLGWQEILTGGAQIIVAGGAESMSRVPYLVEGRWGFKLGNQPLIDAMYRDGFVCPISKLIMGETAEISGGAVQDFARRAGCVRARKPPSRCASWPRNVISKRKLCRST